MPAEDAKDEVTKPTEDDTLPPEAESVFDLLLDDEDNEERAEAEASVEGEEGAAEPTQSAEGKPEQSAEGTEQPEQPAATAAAPGPTQLSGEDVLRLFAQHPEAQELARRQLQEFLQTAEREAALRQQSEEYQKLLSEGNYEEIGRRFVQAAAEQTIRQSAHEEAVRAAYTDIYLRLFAQPELRDLPEADRERLAPKNFESDADYIAALAQYIAERRQQASIEERVNQLLQEKLEALRNMQAAQKATRPSPSGLPPAAQTGPFALQTAEDLIRQGWQEILEGT